MTAIPEAIALADEILDAIHVRCADMIAMAASFGDIELTPTEQDAIVLGREAGIVATFLELQERGFLSRSD
jgi:hypothetical protein